MDFNLNFWPLFIALFVAGVGVGGILALTAITIVNLVSK